MPDIYLRHSLTPTVKSFHRSPCSLFRCPFSGTRLPAKCRDHITVYFIAQFAPGALLWKREAWKEFLLVGNKFNLYFYFFLAFREIGRDQEFIVTKSPVGGFRTQLAFFQFAAQSK